MEGKFKLAKLDDKNQLYRFFSGMLGHQMSAMPLEVITENKTVKPSDLSYFVLPSLDATTEYLILPARQNLSNIERAYSTTRDDDRLKIYSVGNNNSFDFLYCGGRFRFPLKPNNEQLEIALNAYRFD